MSDTTYVMNLRNRGLTRYTHWPFGRLCRFRGTYIGMKDDGLYQVSNSIDGANGTNITATVASGNLDFGVKEQKRVRAAYLGYRCSGDVNITLQDDNNAGITYTVVQNQASGLTQRRVLAARGRRGKYWKFTISNVAGKKLDLDNIELFVEKLERRI